VTEQATPCSQFRFAAALPVRGTEQAGGGGRGFEQPGVCSLTGGKRERLGWVALGEPEVGLVSGAVRRRSSLRVSIKTYFNPGIAA